MTDFLDTSGIPDSEEYWDGLAARVSAAAVQSRTESVLNWLARPSAVAVAVCLVLAAVVGLLAQSSASRRDAPARDDWTRLLAPSDTVGRIIATDDRPPAIDRLINERGGGVK
jgi:hypothetical protein